MKKVNSVAYSERVGRFIYGDAIEKVGCREFKLDCLEPFADDLKNFLTLSADTFAFEKNLALNSRFSKGIVIDSFEFHRDTFLKGQKEYKKLKKELKKVDAIVDYKNNDIFTAEFHKYNVIDLDLCGSFSIENLNKMVSAFQKFERGVAFVTLTKVTRNSKLKEVVEFYGSKDINEFRDKGFANYLNQMCGLVEFATPYTYKNSSKSAWAKEMITYVFTKNM